MSAPTRSGATATSMSNLRALLSLVAVGVVTLASCVRVQATRNERALAPAGYADLIDVTGRLVGSAELFAVESGVRITAKVTGLAIGEHGVHLHSAGRCDLPDFTTAGAHFNPTMAKHGLKAPDGPHAGDLLNLTAAANVDTARYEQVAEGVRLTSTGPESLLDADGASIVVHAERDDDVTNPAGNSGARVACGVIRKR